MFLFCCEKAKNNIVKQRSTFEPLNDMQQSKLDIWLREHHMHGKRLHRIFSDALPIAYLIKQIFGKYVDVHNYPAKNSTHGKLSNWLYLNEQVLKRLDMKQSDLMLKQISQSKQGYVNVVLYKLMLLDQQKKEQLASNKKPNRAKTFVYDTDENKGDGDKMNAEEPYSNDTNEIDDGGGDTVKKTELNKKLEQQQLEVKRNKTRDRKLRKQLLDLKRREMREELAKAEKEMIQLEKTLHAKNFHIKMLIKELQVVTLQNLRKLRAAQMSIVSKYIR